MDKLQGKVVAYLQAHRVMSLATVGVDGVWGTAVFYVNDLFNLYFLSAGHTRHGQNMHSTPQIAATIQENYKEWATIQGIQLQGVVVQLGGVERQRCIQLYQTKFPFLGGGDVQIETAVSKANWYRLTPTQLYFIDNQKGLGHRDKIKLPVPTSA